MPWQINCTVLTLPLVPTHFLNVHSRSNHNFAHKKVFNPLLIWPEQVICRTTKHQLYDQHACYKIQVSLIEKRWLKSFLSSLIFLEYTHRKISWPHQHVVQRLVLNGQDDRNSPVQQFTEEQCTYKYETQINNKKKIILPCFPVLSNEITFNYLFSSPILIIIFHVGYSIAN